MAGCLAAVRRRARRRGPEPAAEADSDRHREDMIFIWTSIHGIPRDRAEAMYEAYQRASAAASLGLRGK
jgi:hypothetical protein